MRWNATSAAAVVGGLISACGLGPAGSVRADTGDAPIYAPAMAWEAAVDCGPCSIAIADGDAIVHERAVETGGGRLRAIDLSTGEERWSTPALAGGELEVTAYGILIHDKQHYEIHDPATGRGVVARDGVVAGVNAYGVLIAAEQARIVAVDIRTGGELWTLRDSELAVADVCRDIVIVVGRSAAAPFRVLDQRTGEERWRSDDVFDRRTGDLSCGGWWIYATDGDELIAYDAPSGYTFFQVDVAGRQLELYREMALVELDDGSGDVVAVDRLTGFVAWRRPAGDIGRPVSPMARLRTDGRELFTVHVSTGDVVNRLRESSNGPRRVVGASETRVTLVQDTTVTTYGLSDLGVAWELDLGSPADDLIVGDGVLLARFGARLVAYE